MRKLGVLLIAVTALFVLGIVMGCGKDSPSGPSGPSPTRKTYTWVDADWTLGPHYYKAVSRDFSAGDTLSIEITRREGDYIALMFFAEASEFEHWKNGENWVTVWFVSNFGGIVGSWSAEVPSDGTYYFVMYNDAVIATIKASVLLKVVWWE